MTTDLSDLQGVIQLFFDGLYEGDADKLAAACHPMFDLRWQENGQLKVRSLADWLKIVRTRPSGKAVGHRREDLILAIDRHDRSTAYVKVRSQMPVPPHNFTDYLALMRLADGWKIISKTSALW